MASVSTSMNGVCTTPCSRHDQAPARLRTAADSATMLHSPCSLAMRTAVSRALWASAIRPSRISAAATPRWASAAVGDSGSQSESTCCHRSSASGCAWRDTATAAARASHVHARAAWPSPSGAARWAWWAIVVLASAVRLRRSSIT